MTAAMEMSLFRSPGAFRDAFRQGLVNLMAEDGLGLFILACANAGFDPQLHTEMGPRLRMRFAALVDGHRETLAAGRQPAAAEDDLLVFLKLALVGFDALGVTEHRRTGPWELQFNPLRAFRPPRMARHAGGGLQAPFDPRGFSFNKPFMLRERIAWGHVLGRPVDLYYNKFPFTDLHGLLVPERERGLPQFLTAGHHAYLWDLTATLGVDLPGVGFGYNAYGAFASVNHLHFHMFLRQQPLPVAASDWTHNGGATPYPAACERYGSPDAAWDRIAELHHRGTAYNLVYLPGAMYCFPRRPQSDCPPTPWGGGTSWFELAGGVITFNRDDYRGLDGDAIAAELAKVAVAGE